MTQSPSEEERGENFAILMPLLADEKIDMAVRFSPTTWVGHTLLGQFPGAHAVKAPLAQVGTVAV